MGSDAVGAFDFVFGDASTSFFICRACRPRVSFFPGIGCSEFAVDSSSTAEAVEMLVAAGPGQSFDSAVFSVEFGLGNDSWALHIDFGSDGFATASYSSAVQIHNFTAIFEFEAVGLVIDA